MSSKKGPNEIYCRACGEPIKRKAEICPECGVRNESKQEHSSSQSYQNTTQNTATNRNLESDLQHQVENEIKPILNQVLSFFEPSTHDPSEHTTTVSSSWHYGIAASTGLWIIAFSLAGVVETVSGLFGLLAWIIMPVSVYFDSQWVRATTQWNPSLPIWIILSIIPLINVIAGIVYLIRRNNISRVSSPNRSSATRRENDKILEELRKKYIQGEITDEEFEKKVEQLVGTEDSKTAQVHMRTKEKPEE